MKSKYNLLLILLILLLPTIVKAKGEISVSCPDEIYVNQEIECSLYYTPGAGEKVSGANFQVKGINSVINDIKTSKFSLAEYNQEEGLVVLSTSKLLEGKIELVKIKLTPNTSAQIKINDIEICDEEYQLININDYTYDIFLKSGVVGADKDTNNNDNDNNNKLGLDSLTVTDHELSPSFDPQIYEYTLETTLEEIEINAKTSDSNIKISGTGLRKLELGNNVIEIVITDNIGQQKKYVINVNRSAKIVDASNIPNANTGIKSALSLIILLVIIIGGLIIIHKKYKTFSKI